MTATDRLAAPTAGRALCRALAATSLTLARRFSTSSTLWCASPAWPWHARHVAVEFVHPVIMGKRALPAIAPSPPGFVSSLRLLARPGDVLLVIGPAGDLTVEDLILRARAWGLTTVWCGAGSRPSTPTPDHLLWIDDMPPDEAASSGRLVMLYHLLWELTHVVFEHPGLLVEPATSDCEGDVCITCSDQAVVAEVRDAGEGNRVAVIAGGHIEHVDGSLVGPLDPGDLVLVHAGVAISRIGDEP